MYTLEDRALSLSRYGDSHVKDKTVACTVPSHYLNQHWLELNPWEHVSLQFEPAYNNFHWKKWIWKCHKCQPNRPNKPTEAKVVIVVIVHWYSIVLMGLECQIQIQNYFIPIITAHEPMRLKPCLIHKCCEISNMSHTLECNKIVDHSDVVGAAPALLNYIFIIFLMDWAKTKCKTTQETYRFCDLVCLILEIGS